MLLTLRARGRLHLLMWVIALILPWGLRAQTTPSCKQIGSLTTATNFTSLPNNSTNPICNVWALQWWSTGFSAITIELQGSDDNSTWTVFTGASTVYVGTNPASTLSGTIKIQATATNAWVRVNVTSATGTGTVNFQLYGLTATISDLNPAGGSGGGGACASLGGDLSGTCAAATVVGLDAVPFCAGFMPANGQSIEYTTGSSPNPCYTAAATAGSGTVGSGTAGQVAYYAATGTTVMGDAALTDDGTNINVVNRNISFPLTNSTASSGSIFKNSLPFLHNYSNAANVGANTFLGISAGNFSLGGGSPSYTGSNNTGLGAGSLTALTSGFDNVGVGSSSLVATTSGSYNAALGALALNANTSGSYNMAVGGFALYSSVANSSNTALGYAAQIYLTAGGNNASLGYSSASTYAHYANSTFLGAYADAASNALTNCTAIGFQSICQASNTMTFGNSSNTNNLFYGAVQIGASAGATATVNGQVIYDSTANNLHAANNSGDAILPVTTATPTNGDCVSWSNVSGSFKLADAGSACGSGGGAGAVNPACTFATLGTSCTINTAALNIPTANATSILLQCFTIAAGTQTSITATYTYTTGSGIIQTVVPTFSSAAAGGYCSVNAGSSTGPQGPAGPSGANAPSTFSSIPSCTTTPFYQPLSNSLYSQAYCNGSSVLSYFMGGQQLTPPSGFSWQNQSTATLTTTNGGEIILSAVGANGANINGRYVAYPTPPFTRTLTARIKAYTVNGHLATNGIGGIYLSDGTKVITYGLYGVGSNSGVVEPTLIVQYGPTVTNITTNVSSTGQSVNQSDIIYLKFNDGLTCSGATSTGNRYYCYSYTNSNFIPFYTEADTVNITAPTQIGYFTDAFDTSTYVELWALGWQ